MDDKLNAKTVKFMSLKNLYIYSIIDCGTVLQTAVQYNRYVV